MNALNDVFCKCLGMMNMTIAGMSESSNPGPLEPFKDSRASSLNLQYVLHSSQALLVF
jgi:hypothetical protein